MVQGLGAILLDWKRNYVQYRVRLKLKGNDGQYRGLELDYLSGKELIHTLMAGGRALWLVWNENDAHDIPAVYCRLFYTKSTHLLV